MLRSKTNNATVSKWTLAGLMACTSMATDIYLPAMPAIERELGGQAELTISGFLFGFALAQLVWGPISDRIGRRTPLICGMSMFILGSIGCALSNSMTMVIMCRIFQAVGACTGPMLSRSIVRDVYSKEESARMLSTLMIILAVSPICAPLLGSFLQAWLSWRAVFVMLAILASVLLVAVIRMPETNSSGKATKQSFSNYFLSYRNLLKNRAFMGYTMTIMLFSVAIYAFVSGSSDMYINHFKIEPWVYSILFGINMVGVVAVSALNRNLVGKYSFDKLLKNSSAISFAAAAVMLALSLFGMIGIVPMVVLVFIICSNNGIMNSCSNAAALNVIPSENAGAAAALLGSLQYGSGIISSVLLALPVREFHSNMMVLIIFTFTSLSALNAGCQYKRSIKQG